jgi:autotransporter-associated beta strand protein
MKNATYVATSFHGKTLSSRRFQQRLVLLAAVVLLLLRLAQNSAFAGSATWKANPVSSDWNTAANWTPPTIPNRASDTATFATSNRRAVSVSANTEVNGIVFNAGASAFTITANPAFTSLGLALTLSGVGITNNSGVAQNFVTAVVSAFQIGQVHFTNSATAGTSTIFTNNSATINSGFPGVMRFSDTSTAGNGSFTNNGGAVAGATGGYIIFDDGSTAGNGTFTNNGATVNPGIGAITEFRYFSSAGNAMITNNGGAVSGFAEGGVTYFFQRATAANATLIANGGLNGGQGSGIFFYDNSKGGMARVEVFGNGTGDFTNGILDIGSHNAPGVRIGSLEGTGTVSLGANNLTVGSNNLNTKFSGLISGDSSGSLTKIGTGKLVLSHRNTYTGGTTVKRGKLIVNNSQDSGTGSGPVQVDDGWLGGKGIIAGSVTVGTGSGSGAVLAPGYVHGLGSPGALTIQSALTFSADATYNVDVNSSNATADEVVANGVTINSGAQFSFADLGSGTLTPGTVFTVINNTAATPIAGTFSNLPDGSTFTANGNTYQVSYQGGDGNDLTLTVVP